MQLTIEGNLQLCPKFNNVVNLTLGRWCLDANFYALILFMQNTPRLEKLTLKLHPVNDLLQMCTDPTWKFCTWACLQDIAYLFSLLQFRYQQQRIIGELTERSFTCGHLKIVEVICSENDPLINHLVDFFVSSGMTTAQIHIKPKARCSIKGL